MYPRIYRPLPSILGTKKIKQKELCNKKTIPFERLNFTKENECIKECDYEKLVITD